MSELTSFHFLRPAWLLLLPVVVWVWWRVRESSDSLRGWRSVMDPELLTALTIGKNTNQNRIGLLLLAGWLLGTIAVTGPTWRPEPSPFADDPVPVVLVLNAGETMDLSDLSPTRMERARLKIADFAEARNGQPLGLVAYAGSSHLVLPPTRDTSVVANMAAEISPAIMPASGDDLASALELANSNLGEAGGSIIVVTDTVAAANRLGLEQFREGNHAPIHFLAVARKDTPEMDDIQAAASILDASVELLSADSSDVVALVRIAANTPVAVSVAGEGTRWAEAGWWLVPVLALMSLFGFRRVENGQPLEGAS